MENLILTLIPHHGIIYMRGSCDSWLLFFYRNMLFISFCQLSFFINYISFYQLTINILLIISKSTAKSYFKSAVWKHFTDIGTGISQNSSIVHLPCIGSFMHLTFSLLFCFYPSFFSLVKSVFFFFEFHFSFIKYT